MKKSTIFLLWIILLGITITTFVVASPSGNYVKNNDMLMWTKAICNEENYCIDVQITCKEGNVSDIKPISKGVYFQKQWKDPRPEEFKKEFCQYSK